MQAYVTDQQQDQEEEDEETEQLLRKKAPVDDEQNAPEATTKMNMAIFGAFLIAAIYVGTVIGVTLAILVNVPIHGEGPGDRTVYDFDF